MLSRLAVSPESPSLVLVFAKQGHPSFSCTTIHFICFFTGVLNILIKNQIMIWFFIGFLNILIKKPDFDMVFHRFSQYFNEKTRFWYGFSQVSQLFSLKNQILHCVFTGFSENQCFGNYGSLDVYSKESSKPKENHMIISSLLDFDIVFHRFSQDFNQQIRF